MVGTTMMLGSSCFERNMRAYKKWAIIILTVLLTADSLLAIAASRNDAHRDGFLRQRHMLPSEESSVLFQHRSDRIQSTDRKAQESVSRITHNMTDMIRVWIKYGSENGREQILDRAHRVFYDHTSSSTLTVQIDRQSLENLSIAATNVNDIDILRVELDHRWYQMGYLERYIPMPHNDDPQTRHRQRRLDQTIPYGIPMIQADQLAVGRSPVRVCVIDTGAAIYHPDLNSTLFNGTNRVSNIGNDTLIWNHDVRSHGTHIAVRSVLDMETSRFCCCV
jgi:hypothetical protein